MPNNKQECIPVGCVPSATVAVCGGGVYLFPGGVPGPRGVYLVPGGVPGPGGYLPMYSPRGQTHRCKNITFTTSLRTVKSYLQWVLNSQPLGFNPTLFLMS